MIAYSVTTRWLRKLRRLTWLLVGVPVALGLAYTWRAAWRGDVLAAAFGAGATLGVLGVGVLLSGVFRLGLGLLRSRRKLDRMERRLAALGQDRGGVERRLSRLAADHEKLRGQADQDARAVAEWVQQADEQSQLLEKRVASLQTRIEAFCKLHDDQADRLDRRVARLEGTERHAAGPADAVRISDSHWADENTPPGERTVTAFKELVGEAGPSKTDGAAPDKQRLRQEFASLIHRRDYVAALAKGDELANRFGDSAAAVDFRRVRPHLVRKIQLLETASVGRGT